MHRGTIAWPVATTQPISSTGVPPVWVTRAKVRELADRAGFRTLQVVPFDDPFNVLYQARV